MLCTESAVPSLPGPVSIPDAVVCCDRSGRAPLSRRYLRSPHPGKRRNVRGNAVSRTRSASLRRSLLILMSGTFSRLCSCRRGLIPPQPSAPPVQGEMNSPQNFLPGKNFCVLPRTGASGRGRDAPCGEGSQTGEVQFRRGNRSRLPRNVKTAAPETQQMMGAENINERRRI